MAKQCRKCSVDLVVSDNWNASQHKCGNYICRPCKAERGKIDNAKYGQEYFNEWARKAYHDNPEKFRARSKITSKQFYWENIELSKQKQEKYRYSIDPGIYSIYNHDELIYIGQSGTPYRRRSQHFSHSGNEGNSKICIALGIGELKRKNLTFKMMEFIDDAKARYNREQALIQQHKPRYN